MNNFGHIKHIFKEALIESVITNDAYGKELSSKFIKEISNNKILRNQFYIYNNIEDRVSNGEINDLSYVLENTNIMKKFSTKDILLANKKLFKLVEKFANKYSDNKLSELHDSIHKLIIENVSVTNIDSRVKANSVILEHIKNNKLKESTPEAIFLPQELLVGVYVDAFNKKYSELNESELNIIKKIATTNVDDRKVIFSDLIRECINLINEKLNTDNLDLKGKLLDTKDKLLNYNFNTETYLSELPKLFNLKNSLA